MQLRRVVSGGRPEVEGRQGDQDAWAPVQAPPWAAGIFDAGWETSTTPAAEGAAVLPFQPLSFRDFLLFEQHNIDAARGLVRRFHPGQYRAARLVEQFTRRPFPAFRPRPLFRRQPIYYFGNHLTFVPSGTPIGPPAYSDALDYELELGFVLARPLRDAQPEEALGAIGAFVLVNDVSARDVQRAEMASGFGPQKSKHFASSMSATAVTPEHVLPRIDELTGTVAINGTVVSEVSSAGMRWGLGEVLAHASRGETLLPGELFATGTLPGGSGMETGHWLRSGDTLTMTLDGIGRVEHEVV
jgi:2-keto-4-pentenoate hydratase/2-oxohepta-3-ene-1,7-dioic acid hydratase in catechol pathway